MTLPESAGPLARIVVTRTSITQALTSKSSEGNEEHGRELMVGFCEVKPPQKKKKKERR